MRTYKLISLLAFCLVTFALSAQTTTFEKSYFNYLDKTFRRVYTDNLAYYISGHSGNIFSGGTGANNTLFAKMDMEGNLLWDKTFSFDSPTLGEVLNDMKHTNDNYFLLCGNTYGGDIANLSGESTYLFKVDETGNMIWKKAYSHFEQGDTSVFEEGACVLPINDNEYYLLSTYIYNNYSIIDSFGSGIINTDIILRKISAIDGSIIWEKKYGGLGYDIVYQAVATLNNEIILCGKSGIITDCDANNQGLEQNEKPMIMKISAQGDSLWSLLFDTSMPNTCQGGYFTNGISTFDGHYVFSSTSVTGSDDVLVKIDENGNIIWSKSNPITGIIKPDYSNNFLVYAEGSIAYLTKYDFYGNVIGNYNYAPNRIRDLAFTSDGGWAMVGVRNDSAYLIKVDCMGNIMNPVNCNGVGLEIQAGRNNVNVYPNPTKGLINIQSEFELEDIELYEVSGKLISQDKIVGKSQQEYDISFLPKGIYYLKIGLSHGKNVVQKIVVE